MITLITGANRGIGFEVARQLGKTGDKIILGCRDQAKGLEACKRLSAEGVEAVALVLDVTSDESVNRAFKWVTAQFGRLDVLINNAGVFLDPMTGDIEKDTAMLCPPERVLKTFDANTLGAFRMCKAFVPLMKKSGFGRVINVSSGMGQLSDMLGGYAAYRISKTALNAVTRIFAEELTEFDIQVNSVCPGWVKTDMGGPDAERSVEKGAETIVWLAKATQGSPTGEFFRDKEKIDW